MAYKKKKKQLIYDFRKSLLNTPLSFHCEFTMNINGQISLFWIKSNHRNEIKWKWFRHCTQAVLFVKGG